MHKSLFLQKCSSQTDVQLRSNPAGAAAAIVEVSRRQWMRGGAAFALSSLGWVHAKDAPVQAPVGKSVSRLISVGGAITEVVYALGAESLLVGTDTTSLYPEAATRTAKVGYVRQLSAEGLLSLRPDALIGSGEAGPAIVLEQVKAAGVHVELVPTEYTFHEVLNKVETVGRVTGRTAQAASLVQRLQQQWDKVTQRVQQARQRPRALFILSHSGSPMVAGTGTAAHALLTMAGASNAVTAFTGYRPLTAEAMAAAAPEVIVNSTQGIEALGGAQAFWKRPELALTPAFARKALVTMEASHLLGFGPRLPSAVGELHDRLLAAVA